MDVNMPELILLYGRVTIYVSFSVPSCLHSLLTEKTCERLIICLYLC